MGRVGMSVRQELGRIVSGWHVGMEGSGSVWPVGEGLGGGERYWDG